MPIVKCFLGFLRTTDLDPIGMDRSYKGIMGGVCLGLYREVLESLPKHVKMP